MIEADSITRSLPSLVAANGTGNYLHGPQFLVEHRPGSARRREGRGLLRGLTAVLKGDTLGHLLAMPIRYS
jgi:hypothetical protein